MDKRLIVEFAPGVAFVLGDALGGIFLGSACAACATVVAIAVRWRWDKSLPWLAISIFALTAVLVTVGFFFNDTTFVKISTTVGSLAFAVILGVGLFFKPSLVERTLGYKLQLTAQGWLIMNLAWIAVTLLRAAANEVVWRNASDQVWVLYNGFATLPGSDCSLWSPGRSPGNTGTAQRTTAPSHLHAAGAMAGFGWWRAPVSAVRCRTTALLWHRDFPFRHCGHGKQDRSRTMIGLRFEGDVPTTRRAVFERAARRWDGVVQTAFPPVQLEGQTVAGVRIDVSVRPLDGANGVLGQAGPSILRPDTGLPVAGIMEFDQADAQALESANRFEDVVLHEMAHVLGFGTLWERNGLIAGAGTMDPRFVGPSAAREFAALDPSGGAAVPVANTGGPGTREGHWRELVFGNELMTGFLSGDVRPLSRLTLGSFEDLGYSVNYGAADAFALPSFRELALMGITEAVRICDLCRMGRPDPVVLGQ
ncbi:septation protein IspZ [uncultured Tateyamaria sp.]|uniref:septation protein IspZ n=1 Tax=uncultured Tateyamaria sp. TaxID=455651 RepID=UPI002621E9E0|nr:septation protein IspZ [uncultured Tateyamaria sp.]